MTIKSGEIEKMVESEYRMRASAWMRELVASVTKSMALTGEFKGEVSHISMFHTWARRFKTELESAGYIVDIKGTHTLVLIGKKDES